jgi:hypothetical protein
MIGCGSRSLTLPNPSPLSNLDDAKETLLKVLHEFDRDRQLAARDREILLLRLENALLKSGGQSALLPGATAQNKSDLEARVAVLETEVAELKRRLAEQNPR